MTRQAEVFGLLLVVSVGALGCAADASTGETDELTLAANDLEALRFALEEGTSDEDAESALSDESMEMVAEGTRMRGGHGRHGKHVGRRGGHRHGGLLMWFGDLEALQGCRELKDTCAPETDTDCRAEIRMCVQDVIAAAFAAACEEKTAMCMEDEAPGRACERISVVCSGDADGFLGLGRHGGKHGRGPKGQDDDEDAGVDEGRWGDRGDFGSQGARAPGGRR